MIGPAFSEDDELLSYLILRFTNIHAGRMMCSPNLYQNTALNLYTSPPTSCPVLTK